MHEKNSLSCVFLNFKFVARARNEISLLLFLLSLFIHQLTRFIFIRFLYGAYRKTTAGRLFPAISSALPVQICNGWFAQREYFSLCVRHLSNKTRIELRLRAFSTAFRLRSVACNTRIFGSRYDDFSRFDPYLRRFG